MIASSIFIVIALLLAVGVVVMIGVFLHLRKQAPMLTLPALIALVIIGMAIQPIVTNRDLRFLAIGFEFLSSGFQSGWSALVGKGLLYLTLLIAGVEILNRIVSTRPTNARGGAILLIGLLFYFFLAFVVAGLLGAHSGLAHQYFYLPIIFSAIFLAAGDDPTKVVRYFRNGFGAVMIATALVALIHPNMVIQTHFRSSISLLDFRLWGLAAHANAFGPIALTFLILLFVVPFERRAWNIGGGILGTLALLAAQSKTVWVIALVLVALYLANRVLQEFRRANAKLMSIGILGVSFLGICGLAGVTLAWSFGFVDLNLSTFQDIDTKGLSTLSGRDLIWELTIAEWRSNPLFGYGLSLWDEEFRHEAALPSAFHAHNQFLQTLGASGAIGLLGLITYLAVLIWGTFKVDHVVRPAALSLLLLLLVRSISEPPFEMRSVSDANVILHLCLFALIVSSLRRSLVLPRNQYVY